MAYVLELFFTIQVSLEKEVEISALVSHISLCIRIAKTFTTWKASSERHGVIQDLIIIQEKSLEGQNQLYCFSHCWLLHNNVIV